jgi:hypothetical protein
MKARARIIGDEALAVAEEPAAQTSATRMLVQGPGGGRVLCRQLGCHLRSLAAVQAAAQRSIDAHITGPGGQKPAKIQKRSG